MKVSLITLVKFFVLCIHSLDQFVFIILFYLLFEYIQLYSFQTYEYSTV